mgnify:CR=1 FL=1|jgi:hypothetical protein
MSEEREVSDYIDDIVSAIADVEEFTRGMSYDIFTADRKTLSAVIRASKFSVKRPNTYPQHFGKNIPTSPGVRWQGCGMFSSTIIWGLI